MVERLARSVADLDEGTIVATVEIAAPPERVYRALASKEIVEWWGSTEVYRTTEWTGDVKPGGRWRATGVGSDGAAFAVEGEYLEADPPRKLVYTWNPDWDRGGQTVVSFRLEAIDGGTRVTLRHTGFTSQESCAGHTDGWKMVLGWLKAHAAPRRRAYYLIRLLPPRPTFLADMTDEERRVMGEHVGYWVKLLNEGIAVAFGPVADPKGAWGVGIVEVEDESTLQRMQSEDPALTSGAGLRYEVLPMVQAVVRD